MLQFAQPIATVVQVQTTAKMVTDRQQIELMELPKYSDKSMEQVKSDRYLDRSMMAQQDQSVSQTARIGQAMHMLLQYLPLRHEKENASLMKC